ncbi:MAG TPA: hypothetical protein GX717_03355, partial [Clostridiaceae bacterium]|nr:hypothetical protein [Clostridiaceae bacterium]
YLITEENWSLISKINEDETLPISQEVIRSVAILGVATATPEQAKAWAESKGAATWFIDEIPTFWRVATAAGVDPIVAYAQSALETGYGKFTGVVRESYHNPCGMKTTVGGADSDITAHCQFDSWETGIRAQVDHLALYAGAPGYPKPVSAQGAHIVGNDYESPDPRHFPYLFGLAEMVWELGGKWAPSSQYGENVAEKVLMIRKQR